MVGIILAASIISDGLDTSFKAWMSYKAITNTSSVQYELQQDAWTDDNGLRRYNKDYMVAVGTPYGNVGDRIKITLDTGEVFNAIIGDSKGDRYYHSCSKGANVVEFIVDTKALDSEAKKMGDISYIPFFEGEVIDIQKLDG